MAFGIRSKSSPEKLVKDDPSRAVAHLLAELLESCAHCRSGFLGHEFGLLATGVITKDKTALVKFFQAIKDQDWPKVRDFQSWLGGADDVEAYVVRCSGQNLVVAVIKTHFELFQGARLLYSQALSAEEGHKLLRAFTDLEWYLF